MQESFYVVIPSYILQDKTLTLADKVIYGEISSLCNKEGFCWASNEYISKLLIVGNSTVSRSINKLKSKEYVKIEIEKEEGNLRKIWLLPILKNRIPIPENRITYPKIKDKDYNINTNIDIVSQIQQKIEPIFSYKIALETLLNSSKRSEHIVALYWQFKAIIFENKQQWYTALPRDLRAAKNLIGYTDDQILDTMDWLDNNTEFKWTLESVHKYIDEDLSRIKPLKLKVHL